MSAIFRHRAGLLAMLAGMSAAAAEPSLDFDRTFDRGTPTGQAHFDATYRVDGREHRVEVWRDRDARVRRLTDDVLETFVSRPAGSDEWTMVVLDRRRHIRTDIDRTSLMRIGHFTDWFAQAHGLVRPRGPYRLVALRDGVANVKPVAPCDWYRLDEGQRSTRICWSRAGRVPLAIVSGDVPQWQVTRLALGPLAAGTFAIDDRGYVRNDANQDIQAD